LGYNLTSPVLGCSRGTPIATFTPDLSLTLVRPLEEVKSNPVGWLHSTLMGYIIASHELPAFRLMRWHALRGRPADPFGQEGPTAWRKKDLFDRPQAPANTDKIHTSESVPPPFTKLCVQWKSQDSADLVWTTCSNRQFQAYDSLGSTGTSTYWARFCSGLSLKDTANGGCWTTRHLGPRLLGTP